MPEFPLPFSRGCLGTPPTAQGLKVATDDLPDRARTIAATIGHLRATHMIDAHPQGGLLVLRPCYLVAAGAERIPLQHGATAWLWRGRTRSDAWRELALLGWMEGDGARLYPDLLWRDKPTITATGPLCGLDTRPWRAMLDSPQAQVAWSRGRAATGAGFLPWWLLHAVPTESPGAPHAQFWDAATPLLLAPFLEHPTHAYTCALSSTLAQGGYTWDRDALAIAPLGTTPRMPDAVAQAQGAIFALLTHPSCPLRPVHMAGRGPHTETTPVLAKGTGPLSAHTRLRALHAWAAYARDSSAYAATAFSPPA